jgi:hypothetical protein
MLLSSFSSQLGSNKRGGIDNIRDKDKGVYLNLIKDLSKHFTINLNLKLLLAIVCVKYVCVFILQNPTG